MDYLKRVTTPEEVEAVSKMADIIWKEHYRGIVTMAQIEYMLDKFQSPEAIQNAMDTEGYVYYFIQPEDKPWGYIGAQPNNPEGKLLLSKFYLYLSMRGRGIGSKALSELETVAKGLGLHAIWLTVNRRNPSVALYESMGFKKGEMIQTEIGRGFIMDDFVMEKDI
ncbi:MAG: GNAT family N-acetyltransferase [Christensenellaceae bacterium]|jgi:GNAT superfamily N-acetyltransferase